MLSITFIILTLLLAYSFIFYPALIHILSQHLEHPVRKSHAYQPRVSVILVVSNEESCILSRLNNLAATNYPADQIEIILVSDGSTDGTLTQAQKLNIPNLRIMEQPYSMGKAVCINAALSAATGEILVFADARQTFATLTIRELTANFDDPSVGAASGALEIAKGNKGTSDGLGIYWKLEKFIRHSESRLDSAIGCTGAVYAMRRSCAKPIPPDTILDDIVLPMQAALAGYRIIFDPTATAFDPLPQDPAVENKRKERTLAGNFQMLFRYPAWLLPWKNRLWWQLISHKYLRLLSPFLLVALLSLNLLLLPSFFFTACLILQLLFYILALFGWVIPHAKTPLLTAPAAFVFLNIMVVRGFFCYLDGTYSQGWK